MGTSPQHAFVFGVSTTLRLLRRFNVTNFQEALEDFADCPRKFETVLRRVNFLRESRGQLGKGYRYRLLCPGFDVHPDTDAPITGRTLPDWAEAVALAQQAHRVFAATVFLGWDIAFTARGPVVLEGNSGWDVPTVQMPQRTPLGQTRFVEVCLAHLNLREGRSTVGPQRERMPTEHFDDLIPSLLAAGGLPDKAEAVLNRQLTSDPTNRNAVWLHTTNFSGSHRTLVTIVSKTDECIEAL